MTKDAEPPTAFRLLEAACAALQRTGSEPPLGRLACSLKLAGGMQDGSAELGHLFDFQSTRWSSSDRRQLYTPNGHIRYLRGAPGAGVQSWSRAGYESSAHF